MQSEVNPRILRVIHREIVSALIFSKDGKLLMGKKSKGGVYEEVWHIPGGGTEDEDLIAALKREVLEETKLDIDNAQIELIDNQGSGASEKTLKTGERVWCKMKFNVYKVNLPYNPNEIWLPSNEEIDDLKDLTWFGLDELANIPLTPPSIELFKRLGYIN